jgi:hypothetical protein
LDEAIPGGKMIYRSSGIMEGCNIREPNVDIVSNFNFPSRAVKFCPNNGICFMNDYYNNDEKKTRYFFPSPQEDIDLYNSLAPKSYEIPHPGMIMGAQECLLGSAIRGGRNLSNEDSYIKPNKENKMITITREQLKEIHDIACPTWKNKIEGIAKNNPFGDIELSDAQVQEMRDAATSEQKPTIEKIFGVANQFKVDVRENKVTCSNGRENQLFAKKRHEGVLSPSFNFPSLLLIDNQFDIKIHNSDGMKYIEIIEKKK